MRVGSDANFVGARWVGFANNMKLILREMMERSRCLLVQRQSGNISEPLNGELFWTECLRMNYH